jgi:hypothetical protein
VKAPSETQFQFYYHQVIERARVGKFGEDVLEGKKSLMIADAIH